MHNYIRGLVAAMIMLANIAFVGVVFAQNPPATAQPPANSSSANPQTPEAASPNNSTTASGPDTGHLTYQAPGFAELENPLGGVGINSVTGAFTKLIGILIMIGVPFITAMIIWTGFQFVQAQGNKEKITTARKNLLGVLIGSALLIGSATIANGIAKTVERISGGTLPSADTAGTGGTKPSTQPNSGGTKPPSNSGTLPNSNTNNSNTTNPTNNQINNSNNVSVQFEKENPFVVATNITLPDGDPAIRFDFNVKATKLSAGSFGPIDIRTEIWIIETGGSATGSGLPGQPSPAALNFAEAAGSSQLVTYSYQAPKASVQGKSIVFSIINQTNNQSYFTETYAVSPL